MERNTLTAMPGLQLGKADGLAFLQIVDSPNRLVQKRHMNVLPFPPVVMIQPVRADERRATLTVPRDDLFATLGADLLHQLGELRAARVSGTISLDENAMDTRIRSPLRIAKSARVSVVATTGGVGLLEVGLVVERFRVGATHQVQKLHLPELDGVAFRL